MKTYYAIVQVNGDREGTYVEAEDVAKAFEAATLKCKKRHPRWHVETIAAQEMAPAYPEIGV